MTWGLAYDIAMWVIRLGMIPVVARGRRPVEALAWLAGIFAFPLVGVVIYLVFGERRLRRGDDRHREIRARLKRSERVTSAEHRLDGEVDTAGEVASRRLAQLTRSLIARDLGGLPPLTGNAVELLSDSAEAMDRLIADIDAAEHQVHLLYFIYADDETGRTLGEALVRAAERGVAVRLLVDGFGSRKMLRGLGKRLSERGVRVEAMLTADMMRRPLARFDVRNHRKIAVIDGHIGYAGSMNVHDADFLLEDVGGEWRQIHARLRGPAVRHLQLLFLEDWIFATDEQLDDEECFPDVRSEGDTTVQVVPGGPTYPAELIQHVFLAAIGMAEKRLIITTPYFVPDEPLQLALRVAALRGIRVDLVIPVRTDRPYVDAAGRAYFDHLLQAGVHIWHPSKGVVHAKTITVDDTVAILGSANLDRRSLFINYELMMVLFGAELTEDLRKRQEVYLEEARELELEEWRRRPDSRRIMDDVARLLGPVI